jgi:aspartate/methionine/tyrosine aminotransferase
MQIKPFRLERYFAEYEFKAPYLLCSSDCESLLIDDLLSLEKDSKKNLEKLWLGYTESQGHPLLRDEICNLYSNIRQEEILVHSGAEEAIFNTMNVVLRKGDHVIVPFPCYQSLFEIANSIECEITPWHAYEKDNWKFDVSFVKNNIRSNTKLVIINSPHHPTGSILSNDDLTELVNLSEKHSFIIFSDEVYKYLEHSPETRLTSVCDLTENGISLNVMSKSFGLAGLRIGWLATKNTELYKKLAEYKDYTTICNSAPSEYFATIAIRNREHIINRNLDIIKDNLSALNSFFAKYNNLFSWKPPVAGSIAFPSLKSGNVDEFCKNLVSKTGILLLPGTLYGSSYPNFRIGFGRANMKKNLSKLEECILNNNFL